MKKILLTICILAFAGITKSFSQNIPNPGLENWVNPGFGYEEPAGWVTPNYLLILGNPVSVFKTSVPAEVHSGSYAAKITTIVLSNNPLAGTLPDTIGTMFTGVSNPPNSLLFGYSYRGRPDTLSFYYRYTPMPNDTATCFVRLTYWDPVTSTTHLVADGNLLLDTLCSAYVIAKDSLHYYNANIPDTAVINFTSSSQVLPIPGSEFFVDDMIFSDSPPTLSKIEPDSIYWDAAMSPAPMQVSTSIIAWNDSSMLAGATVKVLQNFQASEDVLEYSTTAGITGTYSAGTLTLTGNATFANYQSALRAVNYKNTSATPTVSVRSVVFTATDGNRTTNTQTRYIDVINTTGITENAGKTTTVHIYPNPAKESVTISCNNSNAKLFAIFNAEGKKLESVIMKKNAELLNTASYPSGIYFVKVYDEKGNVLKTTKFNVLK